MPFNASAFLTTWHNPRPNRAQRRAAYRYAAYTTVRGK